MGPVLGLVLIGCRLALSGEVAVKSYQRLVKGDLLPWLLLSFGLISIAQGGWAQPTSLGFCTLIGGLMLAVLPKPKKKRRASLPPTSASPPAATNEVATETSPSLPMA
jgi:hypothetical protein